MDVAYEAGHSGALSVSPLLPAATARKTPFPTAYRMALSTGELGSSPPRLMLITLAPWSAAHRMPCASTDIVLSLGACCRTSQSLASTFTGMTLTLNAIPDGPRLLLVLSAIVPVTWVPWPSESSGSASFQMKSKPSTKWVPARSGAWAKPPLFLYATPVSSTATVVFDEPPWLMSQAASIWIFGEVPLVAEERVVGVIERAHHGIRLRVDDARLPARRAATATGSPPTARRTTWKSAEAARSILAPPACRASSRIARTVVSRSNLTTMWSGA